MESFVRIPKNEMFYGHESELRTIAELKKAVAGYIDYCNGKGIKERTGRLPPTEYRKAASGLP